MQLNVLMIQLANIHSVMLLFVEQQKQYVPIWGWRTEKHIHRVLIIGQIFC